MNSPDDAVDVDAAHDAIDDAVVSAVVDAIDDTVDGLFSFLMHLVVICSSISHMIARLLVGSVVAFSAHFCS
jgi:hypothetical protein